MEAENIARNKHPEKTVEQILSISYRLFLKKGYEQTTIQDIINELGMSKGAIYHHFKSKEEILEAIGDKEFEDRNVFSKIKEAENLNGLQKLKRIFCNELESIEKQQFDTIASSLSDNPKFVSMILNGTMKRGVPLFQELIEEGKKDGSIHVEDSRSASEVILLLINVWINPMIIGNSGDDLKRKVLYFKHLTDQIGVPFIDEEVLAILHRYLNSISK
ncbi:TetR/AcrR family transcriptional regulator [Lysinibacillus sp. KU-BSD001]|uniref:TetR/AcrR family transcriptional regulator n=1 Tax=Lysinibacillus sp. KU-BSD001 TaxID=3141328 RepID=UPI0036E7DDAD